jgi:hypothetical protein
MTPPNQQPSTISLPLAGLILLAPLPTLSIRTALRGGTPPLHDALVLLPNLHQEETTALSLHKGEFPACAALTTGYVFRVENQATVFYLQRVGRSGCLTTLEVESDKGGGGRGGRAEGCIMGAASLTVAAVAVLVGLGDGWAVGVLGGLVLVRLVNSLVLRRRRSKW